MRILAALGVLGLLACSPATPSAGPPTDAGAPRDAAEEGVPCLFCSDAPDERSLELKVKDEIDQVCASTDGCHGGSGQGHMVLGPGAEFDAMINVVSFENPPMMRVLPGDPLQSYVYIKLRCEGGIPDGDACMPFGSPTDPKLVQLFHDWIEAGAPTQ